MKTPTLLTGFAEIAANYAAVICDVWGVLHNGQQPFDGVDNALRQFRQGGGKVLLLSNAPRPSLNVQSRLDEIGTHRDAYDNILTSGDATRSLLSDMHRAGKKCCHVGPDKDHDLIAGLAIERVAADHADVILLSGMYDDSTETPDDYADMLAQFKARGLPLICPNPDRIVQFGDRIIYCAGALAELYETMGGEVIWVGKPYPMVYQRARAMLAEMGAAEGKILAIGDGAKTDMPGAQRAKLDALFIAGGLAAAGGEMVETPEGIAAILAAENTAARYAMRHLVW